MYVCIVRQIKKNKDKMKLLLMYCSALHCRWAKDNGIDSRTVQIRRQIFLRLMASEMSALTSGCEPKGRKGEMSYNKHWFAKEYRNFGIREAASQLFIMKYHPHETSNENGRRQCSSISDRKVYNVCEKQRSERVKQWQAADSGR